MARTVPAYESKMLLQAAADTAMELCVTTQLSSVKVTSWLAALIALAATFVMKLSFIE
jgi:hypothetical protein